MSAYELADELEECREYELPEFVHKTAVMLRQQADRIAELEKELNHMRSFFGCDPAYYGMTQSEPVGWFIQQDGILWEVSQEHIGDEDLIPLYTTPQTKPLRTSKEIIESIERELKRGKEILERHGIK